MWTDSGNSIWYSCQSAYGTGACLKSGGGGPYPAVRQTVTSPPSGYKAQKMPWDLKESFGTTKAIPIPAIPGYFFPGTKPIKALANGGGGGAAGGRKLDGPSTAFAEQPELSQEIGNSTSSFARSRRRSSFTFR
jgi:rhamnogalacturonan hydrolase